MFKVYGVLKSGNCYKVRLILTQLGLPFEWVELDILQGQSRTPDFLAKNANGKVPVLEIGSGQFLAESNAILHYLSDGTQYLPTDRLEHAQVLQWLFFEQYSHEPYIATSRFIVSFLGKAEEYKENLEKKREAGYAALEVMEEHLTGRKFFVAGQYTIADIGLYAYTHVAHEGGFELKRFSAINAWLDRVRNQPNHVAMVA